MKTPSALASSLMTCFGLTIAHELPSACHSQQMTTIPDQTGKVMADEDARQRHRGILTRQVERS
jgi:hypothetical protein